MNEELIRQPSRESGLRNTEEVQGGENFDVFETLRR